MIQAPSGAFFLWVVLWVVKEKKQILQARTSVLLMI